MVKLEDKDKQARKIKVTALLTKSKDNTRREHSHKISYDRYKGSSSTSYPKRSKEKYNYYNTTSHSGDSC